MNGTGFLFANYRPSPGSALAGDTPSPSPSHSTYASPSRSSNKNASYSWQSQLEDSSFSTLSSSTLPRDRDLSGNLFDSTSGKGSSIIWGNDKGKGKLDDFPSTPHRNPLSSRTLFDTTMDNASPKPSLFGNSSTVNSSPSKSMFSTPNKFFQSPSFPSPSPGPRSSSKPDLSKLGYFAFPPNTPNDTSKDDATMTDPFDDISSRPVPAPASLPAPPSAAQLERLAREKAEAQRGEEEWVRSGGVLRDKDGNRDLERTEKVREELRIRDWEVETLGKWEAYEKAWAGLLKTINNSGGGSEERKIRFTDLPWPVKNCFSTSSPSNPISTPNKSRARAGIHGPPKATSTVTLADLTPESIHSFILDPLKVRSNTTSTKERIRTSLLRWHPDKLTGLISKVAEEDVDDVTEGIGIVIRCLREMSVKT
ncbi:hypothetical protein VKT23_013685 [Stygiomarasmius scandens]|uniref:Uncharacterized protein n=1 Tax=Marasmiellus scandens TaxID=2682957 RepID=A0ABR1J2N7_9AGAR